MKRRISLLTASVALAVGVFAVPATAEMPCHADIIKYTNYLVNHSGMTANGFAGTAAFSGESVQGAQRQIRINCAE